MREFTIMLPRVNGRASTNLRTRLLDNFGGYTEHEATGAWRDDNTGKVYYDHNSVFTVGVLPTHPGLYGLIREIAAQAGQEAQQVSVYIKMPDGNAELVYCGVINTLSTTHYQDMEEAVS